MLRLSWPVLSREVCVFFSGFAFKQTTFPTSLLALPIIRIRDVPAWTSKTYYSGLITPAYLIQNNGRTF